MKFICVGVDPQSKPSIFITQMLSVYENVIPILPYDTEGADYVLSLIKSRAEFFKNIVERKEFFAAIADDDDLARGLYEVLCKILFYNTSEFDKALVDENSDQDSGVDVVVVPLIKSIHELLGGWNSQALLFQLFTSRDFATRLSSLLRSPLKKERKKVAGFYCKALGQLESHNRWRMKEFARTILEQIGLALRSASSEQIELALENASLEQIGSALENASLEDTVTEDIPIRDDPATRPLDQIIPILDCTIPKSRPDYLANFLIEYLIPFIKPKGTLDLTRSFLSSIAIIRVREPGLLEKAIEGGLSTLQCYDSNELKSTGFEIWTRSFELAYIPDHMYPLYFERVLSLAQNASCSNLKMHIIDGIKNRILAKGLLNPPNDQYSSVERYNNAIYAILKGFTNWITQESNEGVIRKLAEFWTILQHQPLFNTTNEMDRHKFASFSSKVREKLNFYLHK